MNDQACHFCGQDALIQMTIKTGIRGRPPIKPVCQACAQDGEKVTKPLGKDGQIPFAEKNKVKPLKIEKKRRRKRSYEATSEVVRPTDPVMLAEMRERTQQAYETAHAKYDKLMSANNSDSKELDRAMIQMFRTWDAWRHVEKMVLA